MKAKIVDGCVALNIFELIETLDSEEKLSIIDALSCQDSVIEFVMQQVIEGWTELGSCGGSTCRGTHDPRHGIDKARRDIAKASDAIVAKEIERLEKSLKDSEERAQRLAEELYAIRHSFSNL